MKLSLEELRIKSGYTKEHWARILLSIALRRKEHRLAKGGWSVKEKNAPLLSTSRIPWRTWLFFKNAGMYINSGDNNDRNKGEQEMLRDYPEFSTRDSTKV